jgi:hypothetical protein
MNMSYEYLTGVKKLVDVALSEKKDGEKDYDAVSRYENWATMYSFILHTYGADKVEEMYFNFCKEFHFYKMKHFYAEVKYREN